MAQPAAGHQIDVTRELGGGSLGPVRLIANGLVLVEVHPNGLRIPTVTTEPGVGIIPHPILYFRDSAVGVQLCCQFPSGTVQVIATEP